MPHNLTNPKLGTDQNYFLHKITLGTGTEALCSVAGKLACYVQIVQLHLKRRQLLPRSRHRRMQLQEMAQQLPDFLPLQVVQYGGWNEALQTKLFSKSLRNRNQYFDAFGWMSDD